MDKGSIAVVAIPVVVTGLVFGLGSRVDSLLGERKLEATSKVGKTLEHWLVDNPDKNPVLTTDYISYDYLKENVLTDDISNKLPDVKHTYWMHIAKTDDSPSSFKVCVYGGQDKKDIVPLENLAVFDSHTGETSETYDRDCA